MSDKVQIGALYIRVSTDRQEDLSPDTQKKLLLDYAKKNSIIVNQDFIFMENGISGKNVKNRPEFQRMISIAKAKEHPIDVILVWKFSRFARNQEESIVYKSMLKKDGIDVVSISEPLVDGPFGTLIERIIEWMDEYYSIRLSGEVIRGMTENAIRGNHQGKVPFGYKLENNQLIVNKEYSDYVKMIFEKYVYKNMSFYGIAKHLTELGILTTKENYFDSRSIKYIISNPIYKGYILWNVPAEQRNKRTKLLSDGIIYKEGKHEAIITEELFELAQKRLLIEYKPKALPPESQRHWLSGILRCSTCGKTLVSAGSNGGFQCSGYLKRKCIKSHFVKIKRMESAVIDTIGTFAEDSKKSIQYTIRDEDRTDYDINILQSRIEKLSEKMNRIKQAYQNGIDTLDEYKENKSLIDAEKKEILEKVNFKKSKITRNYDTEMKQHIKNIYDIISSLNSSKDEKSNAVKSIVDRIVYDKDSEHIDIYFYHS